MRSVLTSCKVLQSVLSNGELGGDLYLKFDYFKMNIKSIKLITSLKLLKYFNFSVVLRK